MDIGWIIAIGVVVILAIIIIAIYNKLIGKRNDVEEGFATMDVYLKKRFDLIPNLVSTVKGYAAHEKETLDNVIRARAGIEKAVNAEERIAQENALTNTLRSLFAVAEAYPDLKANTNFIDLQNQLKSIEMDIANSRKYYNAVVKNYNITRERFPNSIIAGIFGFKKAPMYQISNEQERENVTVEF